MSLEDFGLTLGQVLLFSATFLLALAALGLRMSGYTNKALGLTIFWVAISGMVAVAAAAAWLGWPHPSDEPWAVAAGAVAAAAVVILVTLLWGSARRRRQPKAALPDPDRAPVLQLKAAASRAIHQFRNFLSLTPTSDTREIGSLQDAYKELAHYPELYRRADRLFTLMQVARLGTAGSFIEVAPRVEEAYERLVEECDQFLARRTKSAPPSS